MALLFLEHVENIERCAQLRAHHTEELIRYEQMLDALSRLSNQLTKEKINYVFYKTLRPYKSATVDIDTIIFGDVNSYRHAMTTMRNSNYSLLAVGPMSATFWDSRSNIGIDLYDEIAVSALCYMDKDILEGFSRSVKLPNMENIIILAPEADLLAIVAHSIIKEQMYTLSEYYSFINYLESMDTRAFIGLIKETNLTNAVRTHASITALLSRKAYGKIPRELQQILETIGQESFETNRISRAGLGTPHKYHQITLLKSLLEIIKGEKIRRSVAKQIANMLRPSFTSDFLRESIDHVIRETY